eukprot:g881.t1
MPGSKLEDDNFILTTAEIFERFQHCALLTSTIPPLAKPSSTRIIEFTAICDSVCKAYHNPLIVRPTEKPLIDFCKSCTEAHAFRDKIMVGVNGKENPKQDQISLSDLHSSGGLVRPFADTWLNAQRTHYCATACSGPISTATHTASEALNNMEQSMNQRKIKLNGIGCHLCSEGMISPDVHASDFNSVYLTNLETAVELGCYAAVPLTLHRLTIDMKDLLAQKNILLAGQLTKDVEMKVIDGELYKNCLRMGKLARLVDDMYRKTVPNTRLLHHLCQHVCQLQHQIETGTSGNSPLLFNVCDACVTSARLVEAGVNTVTQKPIGTSTLHNGFFCDAFCASSTRSSSDSSLLGDSVKVAMGGQSDGRKEWFCLSCDERDYNTV